MDQKAANEALTEISAWRPRDAQIQCFKTLVRILDNIVRDPDNKRKRSLNLDSAKVQSTVVAVPAACRFLKTVGFHEVKDTTKHTLDLSGENYAKTAYTLVERAYYQALAEQENDADVQTCKGVRKENLAKAQALEVELGGPTYESLMLRVESLGYTAPTDNNSLSAVAGSVQERKEKIAEKARGTRPILHSRAQRLAESFILHKRAHGSQTEKRLYEDMSAAQLITRLLTRRAQVFINPQDMWCLATGECGQGGFESVGKDDEQPPLTLDKVLSYDEMAVSALVGVSSPTYFINNGNRKNRGFAAGISFGGPREFEEEGIYVGQVGCRFERSDVMEWQQMMVTPSQNCSQRGYGPPGDRSPSLTDVWAQFYGLPYLPTYEEACAASPGRYIQVLPPPGQALAAKGTYYLDSFIMQQRYKTLAETFLAECSERGKAIANESSAGTFCYVVGLGLGVWATSSKQIEIYLEAFRTVIETCELPGVRVVYFGWLEPINFNEIFLHDGIILQGAAGNKIEVRVGKRHPADSFEPQYSGMQLVCQYAWDSNAYPGNEYWMKGLADSGDPAAACCSLIPWLQNPDVNPYGLQGERAMAMSPSTRSLAVDIEGAKAALKRISSQPPHEQGLFIKKVGGILDNILAHPGEVKYRELRLTSKAVQSKILGLYGAVEFLTAAGFRKARTAAKGPCLVFLGSDAKVPKDLLCEHSSKSTRASPRALEQVLRS